MRYQNKPKKQQVIRDNISSFKKVSRYKKALCELRDHVKKQRKKFLSESKDDGVGTNGSEYITTRPPWRTPAFYIMSNVARTSGDTSTSFLNYDITYTGYTEINSSEYAGNSETNSSAENL